MYKKSKAFEHPCLFNQTLGLIVETDLHAETRNLLQQLFWKIQI